MKKVSYRMLPALRFASGTSHITKKWRYLLDDILFLRLLCLALVLTLVWSMVIGDGDSLTQTCCGFDGIRTFDCASLKLRTDYAWSFVVWVRMKLTGCITSAVA